jgi:hypothetical protein
MGRRKYTGIYQRRQQQSRLRVPIVLFAFFICLFCWVAGYSFSAGYPLRSETATFAWDFICRILPGKTNAYIAGALLLCCAAVLLHRAGHVLTVMRGNALMPFFFFLLLNSLTPETLPLCPSSVAIFFLMPAVFELFGAFQRPVEASGAFNATFCLAAGSLIWPQLIWFVLFFWMGMCKFHLLNARNFFASASGIFTVCLLLLGWCVWKDDFSICDVILRSLTDIHPVSISDFARVEWLFPLVTFFLMTVATVYIQTREYDLSLRFRQILSFLLSAGFLSFLPSLLYKDSAMDFMPFFYIPAALLFTGFFFRRRSLIPVILYVLAVIFFALRFFLYLADEI